MEHPDRINTLKYLKVHYIGTVLNDSFRLLPVQVLHGMTGKRLQRARKLVSLERAYFLSAGPGSNRLVNTGTVGSLPEQL